jgi:hypothetical protein
MRIQMRMKKVAVRIWTPVCQRAEHTHDMHLPYGAAQPQQLLHYRAFDIAKTSSSLQQR